MKRNAHNINKVMAKKYNINEIIKLIEGTPKEIDPLKDKEIFMVTGDTGTGKSTGICYFVGAQLERIKQQGKPAFIGLKEKQPLGVPKNLPQIGKNVAAETFYPSAYFREEQNEEYPFIFGDFPGFLENKTPEQKVCVSITAELGVKLTKKIHGVIVFIAASAFLDPRGSALRKVAETLSQLIKIEGDSSPFLFVITQADKIGDFEEEYITNKATAICESLTKTLDEKLAEIENKIGQETDKESPKPNNDILLYIDSIQRVIRIFELMAQTENNVILDVLDEGKSRNIINYKLAAIKKNNSLQKESFNFNTFSEDRREFSQIMYEYVKEGRMMFQKIESLKKQIHENQKESKINTERTLSLNDQLKKLDGTGSNEENKKAIEEMEIKIETNEKNIEKLEQKIESLKKEETELRQEYKTLTESTESTFYRAEVINDPRSRTAGISLGRTIHPIIYNEPDVPLTTVKEILKSGSGDSGNEIVDAAIDLAKIVLPTKTAQALVTLAGKLLKTATVHADYHGIANKVEKFEKGYYEGTYYSAVGSDGVARIEFYAQKKYLPESKAKANEIKNRLDGVAIKGKDGAIFSVSSVSNDIQRIKEQKDGFIKENKRTQDSITAIQKNNAVLNATQKTEIGKDLESLQEKSISLTKQHSELKSTLEIEYDRLHQKAGLFKTIQYMANFIDDFKEFKQFSTEYEKIKISLQSPKNSFMSHEKMSGNFTLFKKYPPTGKNLNLQHQRHEEIKIRSRL